MFVVTSHLGFPAGVLRISSDVDDRKIFLGLKFSIYLASIFWVAWFNKGFWDIQNHLNIRGSARVSRPRPWVLRLK